jgi:aminoglycoside/choline kinase family phosphotransferase
MGDIPAQVDDITVAWLNQVLDDEVGTVADFTAETLGEGVGILGQLARLHLSYEPGHTGPATMIAKCQSPAPENQGLSAAMGFYLREVNFYRHLADHLDISVPHAYHADCGPGGLPFVLLLEDITGARCPDQVAGITVDEARNILDVVATLHAEFWERDSLYALDWLPPMNNPLYKAAQDLARLRWPGFVQRFSHRVPAEFMTVLAQAIEQYPDMLDWWITQGHATFTHTDCRAENYLFGGDRGDDAVTMIDFQLSTRHVGAWDVANLLGGSMEVDLRRQYEAELIAFYHQRVCELGVTGYTLDRCWRDYRGSLLQQAVASVVVSDLQGGNERGDELLEHLFLRPVLAAADHGVGDLLAEF